MSSKMTRPATHNAGSNHLAKVSRGIPHQTAILKVSRATPKTVSKMDPRRAKVAANVAGRNESAAIKSVINKVPNLLKPNKIRRIASAPIVGISKAPEGPSRFMHHSTIPRNVGLRCS